MTTYPVVLATDENYAPPCGVVMESLLQNTKTPAKIKFFIFGSNLREETESKLRFVAESHGAAVEIRSFDTSIFSKLPIPKGFTADAYTRLYAPIQLRNFSRVLYLDCDLLVQRDIRKLFETELGAYIIAAVPNGPAPFVARFNQAHGFPESDDVFNSGVLLINPKRWTQDNITARVVKWIDENKKRIRFLDQDGINVILKGKIKPLEHQWNMEARHYQEWWMGISDWWKRQAIGEQLILHYTGPQKPWKKWTFVPKQRTYRAYLSDTPFASSGLMTTSDAVFEFRRLWASFGMLLRAMRVRGGKLRRATQDGA